MSSTTPLDLAFISQLHAANSASSVNSRQPGNSSTSISLSRLSTRPGGVAPRHNEQPSHQQGDDESDIQRRLTNDGSQVQEQVTQEGGIWGWIVVAGSTTEFFIVLGLVYSFGVMQSELLRRGYASSTTLGWVSSTSVVFFPLLALPITWLISRTSNRFVGLLGALCTGFGYLATSYTFDRPVYTLFLAQSLFGIGYAFAYWSCNTLAGQYFVRKRGTAVGIVYAGSGLGGAVFSVLLSRLIERFGLESAIRIYGVLALVILTPVSYTLRSNKEVKMATFQLSYLKQLNFVLLTLATGIITFSLFIPPFFLPSYAVAAGYSTQTGAWLVAGFNLASAIGRIGFGLLADGVVGPVTSLCLAMLLMAFSILSIWIASNGLLAPLIIFLLINGAASGALLSLQAPVLSSLYGVGAMANTMAMVTMSRAFGSAFGPAIAGALLDISGGTKEDSARLGTKPYLLPLGVMGGISLVAAVCLTVLRWRLAGLDLRKRV